MVAWAWRWVNVVVSLGRISVSGGAGWVLRGGKASLSGSNWEDSSRSEEVHIWG